MVNCKPMNDYCAAKHRVGAVLLGKVDGNAKITPFKIFIG
jgi:hypothetical protein